MADKLYKVTDIDFWDLTIEATECDTDISDIPEEQLFEVSGFKDFHVTLHNGYGSLVNFEEWVRRKSPSGLRK